MARRRKGRDITGWLVLDKPAGPTSSDLVNTARRLLDARKAGHAGTLDPAATGLLAIAFGEATKTVPYITDATKTYRFCVRFGAATETDDAESAVIARSDLRPSDDDIGAALPRFTGDIEQRPPAYSAVKLEGRRAYDLARAGAQMDLAARPLHVARLAMVDRPDADHAVLEMTCGKGGYVRAIARDLGETLGCLGHVAWLRRLRSGPFSVDDAMALDALEALDDPVARAAHLLPLERALSELPETRCDAVSAARLRHGNPAEVRATAADYGDEAWASVDGRAVAIGTYRGGQLYPSRVFNV